MLKYNLYAIPVVLELHVDDNDIFPMLSVMDIRCGGDNYEVIATELGE